VADEFSDALVEGIAEVVARSRIRRSPPVRRRQRDALPGVEGALRDDTARRPKALALDAGRDRPEPVLIADVAEAGSTRRSMRQCAQRNRRHLHSSRLVHGERLLGKLMLYRNERHDWTTQGPPLRTIANHLASATLPTRAHARPTGEREQLEAIMRNVDQGIIVSRSTAASSMRTKQPRA